jgi:hypothetical protein
MHRFLVAEDATRHDKGAFACRSLNLPRWGAAARCRNPASSRILFRSAETLYRCAERPLLAGRAALFREPLDDSALGYKATG